MNRLLRLEEGVAGEPGIGESSEYFASLFFEDSLSSHVSFRKLPMPRCNKLLRLEVGVDGSDDESGAKDLSFWGEDSFSSSSSSSVMLVVAVVKSRDMSAVALVSLLMLFSRRLVRLMSLSKLISLLLVLFPLISFTGSSLKRFRMLLPRVGIMGGRLFLEIVPKVAFRESARDL